MNSDGLLDLNNHNETIGPLTLFGGNMTTGTGTLTLDGGVRAQSTFDGSRPATITGRLDMGPIARSFFVTSEGPMKADVVLVIAGTISASTALVKAGDGTLLLRGPNLSTVAATVNAGALRFEGLHSTTTVLLNAGTVEGTGTIRSITTATTAPKTVRVGTPLVFGVLKVLGSVTLSPTTTFEVKVKGGSSPRPGVDFDQLSVGGPVNLNGARLQVTLPHFVDPPRRTRASGSSTTRTAPPC